MKGKSKGRSKRRPFDHGEPISRIDTRPMVFVFFFVGLVFLLAANQARQHVLSVGLPYAPTGEAQVEAHPYFTLSLSRDGQVALNDHPIDLKDLLLSIQLLGLDRPIALLRAHPETSFNDIALALLALRKAGVDVQDICFEPTELRTHRLFQKSSFRLAHTVFPGEPVEPGELQTGASGCTQFAPSFDEVYEGYF